MLQGSDVGNIAALVGQDGWSAVYSNDFIDTDAFIDTLYNFLTHQQYTKYIRHH